jgi:hypothetical protein
MFMPKSFVRNDVHGDDRFTPTKAASGSILKVNLLTTSAPAYCRSEQQQVSGREIRRGLAGNVELVCHIGTASPAQRRYRSMLGRRAAMAKVPGEADLSARNLPLRDEFSLVPVRMENHGTSPLPQ